MMTADIHRAILAVWRIEQPRLMTSLARMLRDVPLAEDLTQEALVTALEHWPEAGVPERPGAWLMATAKRRALDHLRRGRMFELFFFFNDTATTEIYTLSLHDALPI